MGLILVANTKGGSGKSTTAMHLIAPWVLSRQKSADLVELDDENTDSADFSSSEIKSKRMPLGKEKSAYLAVEKLIERSINERVIVDIGGNRTCTITLRNLAEMGADDEIELIVVPVSSSGKDVDNASQTIEQIREELKHYTGPIVLVISRTSSADMDIVNRENPEALELVKKHNLKGPIILPDNVLFSGARKLNLSAWEIGEKNEKLSAMVQDMKSQAKELKDMGLHRAATRLNTIVVSGRMMHSYIEEQFTTLDGALDLSDKDEVASKEQAPLDKAVKERGKAG